MPVVPFSREPSTSSVPGAKPALVGNTYMMMAAAELHKAGMLFEDRAAPVKEALRGGTMDAVGANSTDFTSSDGKRRVISQTVVGNK